MGRINSWFYKSYKQKGNHYLFPLLTFAVGWWLGMLTTPTIGAIFISITIYVALVIFPPWDRIQSKKAIRLIMTYLAPAIICFTLVVPMWNNIVNIFPSPYKESIRTATSTVEVTVKSDEDISTHYFTSGGYLAFCKGKEALLLTSAVDCFGKQIGENRVIYHGVFNMDANSEATKEKITYLKKTEYIQIGFEPMTENMEIIDGKAIVLINNSVRFEFVIPPQEMDRDLIIILNVQGYLHSIMR